MKEAKNEICVSAKPRARVPSEKGCFQGIPWRARIYDCCDKFMRFRAENILSCKCHYKMFEFVSQRSVYRSLG